MQRYAFKMFLNPGEGHDRRRHEAIWPELTARIREKGAIRSIDPETNILFAYLERADDHGWTSSRTFRSCSAGGPI